jgi:F-type H+-transporting ATPase subunit b
MLIDWYTVVAQAINFLILVWLLKRFLYKPILNAINEREKRIAENLADANDLKVDAQKERDEFKKKNEEFDQQRSVLLIQAIDEVKVERQRLLDNAREESNALRLTMKESIENERDNLNRNIMTRAQQEVFAIARKTLTDLAGVSLEERMTEVFIHRLHTMSVEEKERLSAVLRQSPKPVVIRSAFGLTLQQQMKIRSAISQFMAVETKPQFETKHDLLSGIELVANGQKVAWSIMEYLISLEKSIDAKLKKA